MGSWRVRDVWGMGMFAGWLAGAPIGTVQATPEQWEEASKAFSAFEASGCTACHAEAAINSLVRIATPIELDADTASVLVAPPVAAGTRYYWRWRPSGSVSDGTWRIDTGATITLEPGETKEYEYCAANNPVSDPDSADFLLTRNITCDVFTVSREAGGTPGGITPPGSVIVTPELPGPGPVIVNPTLPIGPTPIDPEIMTPGGGGGGTVEPPNQAPLAVDDEVLLLGLGSSLRIAVLDNDTDDTDARPSVLLDGNTSAQGATLAVEDGEIVYEPPEELTVEDTFRYRLRDSGGLESNPATVTVRLSDIDADGVADFNDNCPNGPNTDQADMDTDGIGDFCDVDPDNSGTPGTSGEEIASGKALFESVCATCHLNAATGAPLLGDAAAWDSRLEAAGGVEQLVQSVIDGKGAMPAFGATYSAAELLPAVRYLAGLETTPEPSGGLDTDDDGVADAEDNCPAVPNPDQADGDADGIGDVCEIDADNDGDGYPRPLDDDDGNNKRLPGRGGQPSDSEIFSSAQALALGRFAAQRVIQSGYTEAAVVMSEAEFTEAVGDVLPGITFQPDDALDASTGIIDLSVTTAAGGSAEVLMQLAGNIPPMPLLRVFNPRDGAWSDFQQDDGNTLASAQAIAGVCPAMESPNFRAGLGTGLRCVRFGIVDGGANDADLAADGQIALVLRLGEARGVAPTPVVPEPGGSGGGGGGGAAWAIGLLWLVAPGLRRWRTLIGLSATRGHA